MKFKNYFEKNYPTSENNPIEKVGVVNTIFTLNSWCKSEIIRIDKENSELYLRMIEFPINSKARINLKEVWIGNNAKILLLKELDGETK